MFTISGFPRGGGANSRGGAPTYDFAKFSRKLHEIERIWTPGGHVVVKSVPPLFAVLSLVLCFEFRNKCNDFMLLATHMLKYGASRHFSHVRCTFFIFSSAV